MANSYFKISKNRITILLRNIVFVNFCSIAASSLHLHTPGAFAWAFSHLYLIRGFFGNCNNVEINLTCADNF